MLSIIQKEPRKHKGTSLDAGRCACYDSYVESDCEAFFLEKSRAEGRHDHTRITRGVCRNRQAFPPRFLPCSSVSRLAILAIVVEDLSVTDQMNAVLHEYKDYIIGRMGIPYKAKHVCLVSIAIDAPEKTIGALGGKLGRICGLTVKTAYSRI